MCLPGLAFTAASAFKSLVGGLCPIRNPLSAEGQIVAAIRRIIRAVNPRFHHLVEECGLVGPQLTVLREAGRPRKTLVSALDRLAKRGLIERRRGASDRRTVNISVTLASHKIFNDAPSRLPDGFRRRPAKLRKREPAITRATRQHIAEKMDVEALDAIPVSAAGPLDGGGGTFDVQAGGHGNVAGRAVEIQTA